MSHLPKRNRNLLTTGSAKGYPVCFHHSILESRSIIYHDPEGYIAYRNLWRGSQTSQSSLWNREGLVSIQYQDRRFFEKYAISVSIYLQKFMGKWTNKWMSPYTIALPKLRWCVNTLKILSFTFFFPLSAYPPYLTSATVYVSQTENRIWNP